MTPLARTPGSRPGKLSPLLLVSVAANLALAGGVGYLLFAPKKTGTGTLAQSVQPRRSAGDSAAVEAFGRIQPAGGVIAVYGPPGDKLKDFKVGVGQAVGVGDTLATLFGDDERQLNLRTLTEQINEAEALKQAIEASAKAKMADLEAETSQATAGLEQDAITLTAKEKAADSQATRAKKELNRLSQVKADGVRVSDQEFESVTALLATAEAEKAVAVAQREKLRVTKEQSAISVKAKKDALEAETKRAVAQVPLESLKAAKAVAERKVKDVGVTAPAAGRVVKLLAKPGETLANQPILQVADTNRLVVLAEVYETDVGRLREWLTKGPVKTEIDARVVAGGSGERKLSGRVTDPKKVATVISRNVLTPLGPREDADRRVVEVEVDLDPDPAAQNFIGLQVRTRFVPN